MTLEPRGDMRGDPTQVSGAVECFVVCIDMPQHSLITNTSMPSGYFTVCLLICQVGCDSMMMKDLLMFQNTASVASGLQQGIL